MADRLHPASPDTLPRSSPRAARGHTPRPWLSYPLTPAPVQLASLTMCPQQRRRRAGAGDLHTEEDVKIKRFLPLLESKGFDPLRSDYEFAIKVQQGRKVRDIYADVVVYADRAKKVPLIAADTKPPNDPISDADRGQAISYARLLPTIAPVAIVTNGHVVEVFDTYSKARLPDLPDRATLLRQQNSMTMSESRRRLLISEARRELLKIDDVQVFKRILRSCHNEIRNNEGYDPTVAFDELSKVMFCKLHEERSGNDNRFTLDVFDETLQRLKVNIVRQIFDETKVDPRYATLFAEETRINLQDRTVRTIVGLFEDYDLSLTGFDVKGEAFEYFLGDTFTGGLGQYFTPRNVVKFITEACDPNIDDKVIDPFCGTGGFLIFAFDAVGAKIETLPFSAAEKESRRVSLAAEGLFGTDWADRTSQACRMNMIVHGDGSAKVFKHHGLTNVDGEFEDGEFQLCLTNPPFGSIENDPDILASYDLGNGRKSQERVILALERAIKLVKPGSGRIGIVVIDGVLNNASSGYVRDYLRRHTWIRAVVGLPRTTFEGYGGRSDTSVLILERKLDGSDDQQDPIFMSVCRNSGYARNGDPVEGNELPAILVDYQGFRQGQPLGAHPHTWVVTDAVDRLDAAYYWTQVTEVDRQEVERSAQEIGELISVSAEGHGQLMSQISTVFESLATKTTPIGALLVEVKDKRPLLHDRPYQTVGVHWWGGGVFIKEDQLGGDIKATSLNRLRPGALIYNRLFAFRGSFARVPVECADTYASNEFPTFVARPDVENEDLVIRYLIHVLNSPAYLLTVDRLSTGSTKTSRNRLKQKEFLNMRVAVPTDTGDLAKVVAALDAAHRLRSQQEELLLASKGLREGVGRLLPQPDKG